MRGFWILLIAVLVAIGAGVGIESANVASGPKATFKTAINSLGASPYLELSMALATPTTGVSGSECRSAALTFDVASADGQTPLHGQTAKNSVDEQISVADEGSDLADLRIVRGDHLYIRIFFSAIAKLPSVPASAKGMLGEVAALIGGSWFSIPTSLISGIEKSRGTSAGVTLPKASQISSAERAKARSAEHRFTTDLLNIAHFSSSPSRTGSATTARISIKNLATIALRDFRPLITGLVPAASAEIAKARQALATTHGRVVARVVTDGSGTMRSAKLSITAKGQSVSVGAVVDHHPLALGAPSDARSLPRAIIRAIKGEFASHQLD